MALDHMMIGLDITMRKTRGIWCFRFNNGSSHVMGHFLKRRTDRVMLVMRLSVI